MVVLAGRALPAQNADGVLARLGLDRLQFVSLGASVGKIDPSQVLPTRVYAISADYGEIAPAWRVVFGVTYWESRLEDRVVQAFVDTLRGSLVDPTRLARIEASHIPIYDVTFGGGLRWQRPGAQAVRPYLGGGVTAHVLNAEGKLIKGTFVERALDNIAAGFFGEAGLHIRPFGRLVLDGQARVDLLSGFRSAQLRAGALYYFGLPRKVGP